MELSVNDSSSQGAQSCWYCVVLLSNPMFVCRFRMKELDIKREDKVVCFGQLLGMCDHVSFPLGESASRRPASVSHHLTPVSLQVWSVV